MTHIWIRAEERAQETPPGRWHGNWRVTRDDPRLANRAAAELFRMLILHSEDDPAVDVQYLAGRAICVEPDEPPCEWIGASGDAEAVVVHGDRLDARLPIPADLDDSMLLGLTLRRPGFAAGELVLQYGNTRYALEAERED